MKTKRLPKSLRKFIRREKARIRREVLDLKEQERLIDEVYQKFLKTPIKSEKKIEQKVDQKHLQTAKRKSKQK